VEPSDRRGGTDSATTERGAARSLVKLFAVKGFNIVSL
jgi:hypothetical protein